MPQRREDAESNACHVTHNDLSRTIIGAAIVVHREFGPGLLERIYEHCLTKELTALGIPVLQQYPVPVPVHYKGERLDLGFRLDLWIDGRVIAEVKAVEHIHDVHLAQLLSYLKLTDCRLGLLINFNEAVLKNGIRRVVNGLKEP